MNVPLVTSYWGSWSWRIVWAQKTSLVNMTKHHFQKKKRKTGIEAHTCNSSTWEVETGTLSQLQWQPELHNKLWTRLGYTVIPCPPKERVDSGDAYSQYSGGCSRKTTSSKPAWTIKQNLSQGNPKIMKMKMPEIVNSKREMVYLSSQLQRF